MPRRKLAGARDRRRRQNAEAQRAYRARQKEKDRNLEQMVVVAWSTQGFSVGGERTKAQISSFLSSVTESSASQNLDVCDTSVSFTASEIYQSLLALSEQENAKCFNIMVREDFTVRDIVKYGLIAMGYAMDPTLFSRAASLSSRSWIKLVGSSCGDVDMKQAVASGVRVMAQLTAPGEWPTRECFEQPCTRLCTNTITLSAMSFVSALHANAAQVKLAFEDLMNDEAQSRFYHTADARNSGLEGCSSDRSRHIENTPLDLLPTSIQRSLPHHPCHDLIPWPSFRSNVIRLSSINPPLIDEDDLCLDMLSGGLRCWGSRMGSMHGRGHGAPWDSRSWEAMPWFLKKWKILISGEDDYISRTSAWWRCLQGIDMKEI
ncbi:hypothetical protein QSH57_005039 [Fusarium oxysporum f. sp. vasinfectum]|nr:hypothetical protein QSH57_005039 [Fusarium oxysporum f. sp. vasinfectum]